MHQFLEGMRVSISRPLDEFRAFEEFVRSFRVNYEVLAAVYGYTRVCIKIR